MKDISRYFWTTAHKSTNPSKADIEALAKWKEDKGRPNKINELILKTKADLKDGHEDI